MTTIGRLTDPILLRIHTGEQANMAIARSSMRIVNGDSVVVEKNRDTVGLVDGRDGTSVRVRFPSLGVSDTYARDDVQHVAELIAEAIAKGSKYANGFSYNGTSTLGDLVGRFGYTADQRLRQDTLSKVTQQLERAGLSVECNGYSRDVTDQRHRDEGGRRTCSGDEPVGGLGSIARARARHERG